MAKLVRSDVNWITEPRSVLRALGDSKANRLLCLDRDFTNVDAMQTYRIREIKGSPHRAFYGRMWTLTSGTHVC